MVLAYWQMHDMGAGGSLLMTLGWMLIVGLLIWALLSLARSRAGNRHQARAGEILDRRLADGAISVEEYERLHNAMHAWSGLGLAGANTGTPAVRRERPAEPPPVTPTSVERSRPTRATP